MPAPILIDGGFSTELAKHVSEKIDGHPLWTSRFLVDDLDACLKAHFEFVKAGSKVIRTNTYQANVEGFIKHMGFNKDNATDPIKDAVKVCREAIALGKGSDVKVGGSVGPIGAWRGDGSEYTGSYCNEVTTEEFINLHKPQVKALIESGVDLLCIETIPCSVEALALLELLKQFPNMKAWLSFSVKNGEQISNGEHFAEVAAECWKQANGQLLAIGANCMDPSFVVPLFESLKKVNSAIPFIAYPNSGERYDVKLKEWVEGEKKKQLIDYVPMWLEMGITYVGGCCRNSATDVKKIFQLIARITQ